MLQTAVNAQYKLTDRIGLVFGLAYFDAGIEIEDDIDRKDISYGYDGGFIGMHFMF